MRGETEMLGLLLEAARTDERVRAAYMNGSRTNPQAPKDIYRDYDIVFVVTETGSFLADKGWIRRFGTPLIVQEPDWNDVQTENSGGMDFSRRYAWLMLFDDGNRIDLTIEIREEAIRRFSADTLTVLLLDKDGLLPAIPPPTDAAYHVQPPTAGEFAACCNDFWWCLNNVAKGLARDELPYAMTMLNAVVREQLDKVTEWYIGTRTGFGVSAGKMGKYFKKYLPQEIYEQYISTYAGGNPEDIWKAVFAMCGLFHTLALPVAAHGGFSYRQDEEDGIREYLRSVRERRYG